MDLLIPNMTHAILARPEHDRLFIDAINAFNCVSSVKEALRCALLILPELATLIHRLYGKHTRIWTKKGNFSTWTFTEGQTGSVQGCPLGPLIHALSTYHIYVKISEIMAKTDLDAFMGAYIFTVTENSKSK